MANDRPSLNFFSKGKRIYSLRDSETDFEYLNNNNYNNNNKNNNDNNHNKKYMYTLTWIDGMAILVIYRQSVDTETWAVTWKLNPENYGQYTILSLSKGWVNLSAKAECLN